MSSEAIGEGRAVAVRRGRLLEYLTVGWNMLEGVASVGAGLAAGTVALVGFGFDSLIEVSSGRRCCGVCTWTSRRGARGPSGRR